VSWEDSERVLSRLSLVLPTEAQWEYAARAGTKTVWWTGDEKESIRGAGSLVDLFCKRNGGASSWNYEEWLDDGYTTHAPVGTYRANAFGLHDTIGNVGEWCRDWRGSYQSPVTKGDGERRTSGVRFRVSRGGGWYDPATIARSSIRFAYSPEIRNCGLGLRPARRITTQ
jgi:sulfatase modifying factor 1